MVITWRQADKRTIWGLCKIKLIDWMNGCKKNYINSYKKLDLSGKKLRYHYGESDTWLRHFKWFKSHRCETILLTICYFMTWINELKHIIRIHLYKLTLNWNKYCRNLTKNQYIIYLECLIIVTWNAIKSYGVILYMNRYYSKHL